MRLQCPVPRFLVVSLQFVRCKCLTNRTSHNVANTRVCGQTARRDATDVEAGFLVRTTEILLDLCVVAFYTWSAWFVEKHQVMCVFEFVYSGTQTPSAFCAAHIRPLTRQLLRFSPGQLNSFCHVIIHSPVAWAGKKFLAKLLATRSSWRKFLI